MTREEALRRIDQMNPLGIPLTESYREELVQRIMADPPGMDAQASYEEWRKNFKVSELGSHRLLVEAAFIAGFEAAKGEQP